jgi:hypothetical protein
MAPQLEDPIVFVVAIGSFDPAAAMPQKLGESGAIRQDEAGAAVFHTLVPGQAVDYSLTWCTVSANITRLGIQTVTPPYVKTADLMQKMIGELMPKAVITQLGINRLFRIRFSSAAERDEFGVRVAPPNRWGSWGKKVQDGIFANPQGGHGGLVNATMREMPVPGRLAGWRDIQIAANLVTGQDALLTLNDHYERVDIGEVPPGLEANEVAARVTSAYLRVLRERFEDSLNTLDEIAQGIVREQGE